jgi:hypothetical protein
VTSSVKSPDASETKVGLCLGCQHVRVVRSDRGSVFYQCRRSLTDPEFPAYPILPVLRCPGFEALPAPGTNANGPGGEG